MSEHQEDAKFLTVQEAADRLKMSRNTLYKLLTANLIPCRRIGTKGGKILVAEADADAYWKSCLVTTPKVEPEPEVKSAGRYLRPPPAPSRRRP